MRLTKILLLCKRVCDFGLGMGLSLGFLKIIIKKKKLGPYPLPYIYTFFLNQEFFFFTR